ncbi:putative cytochrome P450 oxidoreductase/alkane hydroxylase [Podospora appendiculata]|uniref:Cytochrome P450 oxidoreductase/alkane hydroxylase n=1 Tax=Podospora appendiculata TaxID=314037 RepID=A0AAE0X278_9PEZI|nr:putative cytochrome P450 oxidoreductase/alkane hydroxylase [Podospora appendiculata]
MHPALIFAVATAAFHFVALIGYERVQRWLALRKFAREHNCKSTQLERPWDVLGLAKIVSATKHLLNGTTLSTTTMLFDRYGDTYSSKLAAQRVVFTCSPRNFRQVLITRFADYDSSRGIRDHLFAPITPHGIFALDGAEWKAARHLYRDLFSRTRVIFDPAAQEAHFQTLRRRLATDGSTFDIAPLFLNLTLDLTTEFAIGVSADSLRLDQAADKRLFVDSLIHTKKVMARDGFLGPVHVFLSKKEFHRSCNEVRRFVEVVVKQKLEEKRRVDEKAKSASVSDLATVPEKHWSSLLEGLVEHSSNIDELRDGVITILIAGIDSVASLLSTTFWLLARHERVYKKVREAVLQTAGHEPPTYDMLKSLTYLRNIFNEAMRVYPPVPFNARTTNTDTWLPTGGGRDGESPVLVKKGERVVFASWGSHRNPKNFGEDAHEFVPERWENLQADALGFIPLQPRAQSVSRPIEARDGREWTEKLGLNLSNNNGTLIGVTTDPASM